MSQATTPKQVLTAMEWMLENIGWCQSVEFVDEQGQQMSRIGILNGRKIPASMCLSGAFYLVEAPYHLKEQAADLLQKTMDTYMEEFMEEFNDTHTKEEVLTAIRTAKELAT